MVPGDRGALRAWLVLVAPGMLVTRGVIALAFIAAPWLTSVVHVAVVARAAAAALLLAQVASTAMMLSRPGRWSMSVFATLLAIDFLLCGILLSTERQLWGAGVPIAVVALAMSFEVAGWPSVAVAVVLMGAGFTAAVGLDIGTPLLWPNTLMFGTVLSVETSFPGVPSVEATVRSFPTALHVETSFAGASGLGWTPLLLLPVLAIPLAALGIGGVVNLVRVRRARTLQAAPAGHSPMNRSGMATLGIALLLLASMSPASAQCDPSGHAAFAQGLELLSHGDLPAATRIFFQLVQTQPACPEARNNLAVLFVEQDRWDEAAAQLQQALQLNPTYERARVNLARVEARLKEQSRCEQAAATATPEPSATPGLPEGESACKATAEDISQCTQQADATAAATPYAAATPTTASENKP